MGESTVCTRQSSFSIEGHINSDIINISLFLEDFSKCLKSNISCIDFKVKICKTFLELCAETIMQKWVVPEGDKEIPKSHVR